LKQKLKGDKPRIEFIDYLLLYDNHFSLAVIEGNAARKYPLNAKEQARELAQAQCVNHVIWSNGETHSINMFCIK
jgi:type I site-specific restriction endonuclease